MFRKKGKTEEEYKEYTRTNVHSLRFSIYTSVVILITGIIDLLVYIIGTVALTISFSGIDLKEALTEDAIYTMKHGLVPLTSSIVGAWGFGKHCDMVLLIPIILLFSYTRKHKDEIVDAMIPIGGIVLAILVAFECVYQGLVMSIYGVWDAITRFLSRFQ